MRGSPRSAVTSLTMRAPRFEGGFGGRRAVGVYRDNGVGPVSEYGSYSRHDPADFLFVWNGVRAGAG